MGKLIENHPVRLTDLEVAERALKMSTLLQTIDDLKDAIKADSAEKKAEIKEHEKVIRELRESLIHRQEMREVELREEYDYPAGQVHIIRCDNGEVVRVRNMTDEERQLVLFHGSKPVAVGENQTAYDLGKATRPAVQEVDSIEVAPPADAVGNAMEATIQDGTYNAEAIAPAVEAAMDSGAEEHAKPAKTTRAQCGHPNSRGGKCKQPVILGTDRCQYHQETPAIDDWKDGTKAEETPPDPEADPDETEESEPEEPEVEED